MRWQDELQKTGTLTIALIRLAADSLTTIDRARPEALSRNDTSSEASSDTSTSC